MASCSILIVDEDRLVRECLTDMFSGVSDLSVHSAVNGESALPYFTGDAAAKKPNLVIVSQKLANSDPSAFIARLFRHPEKAVRLTPVVVFPTFPVAGAPQSGVGQADSACRLRTVSNLFVLVNGLLRKKATVVEA